ncbi:AAA family ATPase, partial [Planktothrix sp. FACHB-1355]
MEGKRFIRTLRLKNFLSYGSEGETIELQPLNVLIGPNASGKSNLIEAIGLLKATPTDLTVPIRKGGGISDFLWKGERSIPTAEIEAILDNPGNMPIRYKIGFTVVGQRLELVDEAIENETSYPGEKGVYFYYRYQSGYPVLNVKTIASGLAVKATDTRQRHLRREDLIPDQSVLSQRKDPDQYPELTYVGNQFSSIALYRDWHIGRD